MKYLHSKGIVHRDLKLDNLLYSVDEEGEVQVKIADFGLSAITKKKNHKKKTRSEKKSQELKEMWGTVEYFAPEVYDRAYGSQADVWSLGCILYEMLTGELAFPYRELPASLMHQLSRKLLLKKKELRSFENKTGFVFLSAAARDLVKKLLKRSPQQRWDVEEALAHPWLSSSSFAAFESRYGEELVATRQIVVKRAHRRVERKELLRREIPIPRRSIIA